jgi:hypothetical protein
MKRLMAIPLNKEERRLVDRIIWDPFALIAKGPEETERNGELSCSLVRMIWGKIPEARRKWFVDPEYNTSGSGLSRAEVMERNNGSIDMCLRHTHFLPVLKYFVSGPDLPEDAILSFKNRHDECHGVTSGDVEMLIQCARTEVLRYRLDPKKACEEYFKLSIELGTCSYEKEIRTAIKQMRLIEFT